LSIIIVYLTEPAQTLKRRAFGVKSVAGVFFELPPGVTKDLEAVYGKELA
jgi:hypothetical protein